MNTLLARATRTSTAPAGDFYDRWIDHASWPEWDPDTEWCRIDGPAVVGTTGTMKPKGGPRVKFTITAAERPGVYTDVSRLVGARLTFTHTAVEAGEGTELVARASVQGPLAWLWARILGG